MTPRPPCIASKTMDENDIGLSLRLVTTGDLVQYTQWVKSY